MTNNQAPYGADISGYPFGVRVLTYNSVGVASGQTYNGTITVEVIDASQQRITNDNITNIVIGAVSNNTSVIGKIQVQVVNGLAIFDQLTFTSAPGS